MELTLQLAQITPSLAVPTASAIGRPQRICIKHSVDAVPPSNSPPSRNTDDYPWGGGGARNLQARHIVPWARRALTGLITTELAVWEQLDLFKISSKALGGPVNMTVSARIVWRIFLLITCAYSQLPISLKTHILFCSCGSFGLTSNKSQRIATENATEAKVIVRRVELATSAH